MNQQIGQENIPVGLNSPAQTYANSHGGRGPAGEAEQFRPERSQPITPVQGAEAGCDVIAKALPSLCGEAETAARQQLKAFGR